MGGLLHYFIAELGNSAVDRPWTSLLDIHHPDPWHAPVAATTVLVLLMMGTESVRNMYSVLVVVNKKTILPKVASRWFFIRGLEL